MVRQPSLPGAGNWIRSCSKGPADSIHSVDVRSALNNKAHLEKGGDGRAGSALARAGPVRENGSSKIVATLIYSAGVDQGICHELCGPKAQIAHEAVYGERRTVAFRLCLEKLRHYAAFLLCSAWTARENNASSLKTLHSPAALADSIPLIRDSPPESDSRKWQIAPERN